MKCLSFGALLLILSAGCRSQSEFNTAESARLAEPRVASPDMAQAPDGNADTGGPDVQLASHSVQQANDPEDSGAADDLPVSDEEPTANGPEADDPDKSDESDQPPPAPFEVPGPNAVDEERDQADESETAEGVRLSLAQVIDSVHQSYPLLEVAALDYQIATGKQTAAWGAFDTKFKASSENGPTGFYQTYRNKMGVTTPLYDGGEVFGGYRVGRGDFQPWYQERQTNDGGELKAGLRIPLLRKPRD